MTFEGGLSAKSETWNTVAQTYRVELEEGDLQLANDIEEILKKNGLLPGDSLIEMGCGSGHLSLCLAKKGYKVTLLDFSDVALDKARKTFEKYGAQGEFILGDLFDLDDSVSTYDFAWNSGVMEHFGDDEIIHLMENIGEHARKGVLYLVPNTSSISYLLMRARLMADNQWIYGEEYLRKDYDKILNNLGYKIVNTSYVSTASISAYQMWKAEKEQGNISELYKRLVQEKMLPREESYLVAYFASNYETSDTLLEHIGTTVQDTKMFDLVATKIGYEEQQKEIEHLKQVVQTYQKKDLEQEAALVENGILLSQLKSDLEDSYKQIEKYQYEKQNCISQYEKEIEDYKRLTDLYQSNQTTAQKKVIEFEKEILKKDEAIFNLEEYINKRKEWDCEVEELRSQIVNLQQQFDFSKAIIRQKDEYMQQAQQLCNFYATGKLAALNHFAFRIKAQLLKGDREARQAFWKWIKGKVNKTNRTIGDGVLYNPWMIVNEKMRAALACQMPSTLGVETTYTAVCAKKDDIITSDNNLATQLSRETQQILKADYTNYDVIILSVIDYNFRYQRPQHFATRFAANGHRVFYINANFHRLESVTVAQDNLHVIDFACEDYNAIYAMEGSDSLEWMKARFNALIYRYAIRDAVVVVDYPNWVYGAEFLHDHYGFKVITDYMDDYTGFLGTAEEFLKQNCIKLLQNSDVVVASSQFLYDVAAKHTVAEKITIVRNGTEIEHFYQAVHLQNPEKTRKVIGYYGAVSHWFAADKVCYLAKKFVDCDIVIVGEVTEYRKELEKYRNVKLLGEQPYKELPKYLADFDVCLIPFDTSTDLIKATNPVKFYEYLSAGKKVVSTEIPELMPFKDQYVYMSNDNQQFAEYVRLCLDGEDTLLDAEECIAFARENDWQKRYECFAEASSAVVPKVSIIVLTYNNLELNKRCINSILKKTAYANYELIIVDNQSTDGTIDYLKQLDQEKLAHVKIVLNDTNAGFAGGNNLGIREANGDYVLLLNNDTIITRGWLTAMVKHLESNPKYGMCNPVTNSIGNESMIKVHYYNETEMHEFAYQYTVDNMNAEYMDVDRLPLFATMIKKRVIDEVGMLDDGYKVGMFEDDDYTAAVVSAGYDIVIVEDAFIHHVNNASFKKLDDEAYKKIFETNKAIFEKKWGKKWNMPKYRDGVDWDTNLNISL